jgi:2-keto-4-pentenoate hydratase/2-oxohepta-3-ene-1,7-dioic acid hydratase in catechol pathway
MRPVPRAPPPTLDHAPALLSPPVLPPARSKFPTALIAPGEPLVCPAEVKELDWEVELAVVIGKTARRVPAERAMEYVAGFTVAHDVSARDWQLKKNGGQWLLGKAVDGFAPIGPAIVTTDEIGDPHNLRLRCLVNGKAMQDSNTNQLVHKTEACIAWITQLLTLKPGDIILTGTPPGVGCFMKPNPVWLKVGDVVTCEIEKIGSITNTVVAEDAAAVAQ